MKVVYIHSSYRPNDLIGSWFEETKKYCKSTGGDAYFVIKFTHKETQPDDIVVGGSISCGIHARMFHYWGLQDMFSYFATRKLVKQLDEIKPDIIHCHVINDCFLHMGLFVDYVNKHNIKVAWTFHDARVLTGMCPCPDYAGCNQWKTTCVHCPRNNRFLAPEHEIINLSNWVHHYRKQTIGHIKHLTIVTPSKWMAGLVSESYLKQNHCIVINNGINHKVFRKIQNIDLRKKYKIPSDKIILLSVGNPIWELKGEKFLYRLAQELPSDLYVMVMVGCKDCDIKKYKTLKHVLAFPRIDRDELVAFYNTANLFINPTLADNFPTVNLEAQACGCPVIAFASDGTPETVDPKGGKTVPRMDYEALKQAILNFNYEKADESAISFASQFDQQKCIEQYIKLYKELINEE